MNPHAAGLDSEQRKAARFYLELRASGLDVVPLRFDPNDPAKIHLLLAGKNCLLPAHRNRLEDALRAVWPEMLRVLWGEWDIDINAIRQEGGAM